MDEADLERIRARAMSLGAAEHHEIDVSQQICESVHGPVLGTAPGVAFTLKIATRGLEVQSYEAVYQRPVD